MPILTIIGLIFTAIKFARELSAWLEQHPELTASARATVAAMRAQVAQVEASVDDLRDAHARVEAP